MPRFYPRLLLTHGYLVFLLTLLLWPLQLTAEDWIYRIRPGETLSEIKARFLQQEFSTEQLQKHNEIEKDREIAIGTEIRIPLDWLQHAPAAAEIVFLRNEVTLFRETEPAPRRLRQTERLQLGDRLLTAADAVLSIRFADGSRLLLGPATEVILDTLSAYGESGMVDTRVRVQRGRVESRVKQLQGTGARYEIHTPAAVTAVRGTGFRVAVDAATGETRNEVFEGNVSVSSEGESVNLSAGFGSVVKPGQAPGQPSRLLPPPDLSGLPDQVTAGVVLLDWPPLPGATQYHLRVLLAEEEDAVLHDLILDEAQHTFQDLSAGGYEIQLSGLDDQGLEGLRAVHALQVQAAPQPAIVADPEPTQTPQAPVLNPPRFSPTWVEFRWSQVQGAWGYRLMLSPDMDFKAPLFEWVGSDARLIIPQPWQGRFYVRVDALFGVDQEETHSGVYRLEIPGPGVRR